MAARMSPSQAVVASLKAQGVETVFGLDGDHVIYLFDALAEFITHRNLRIKHMRSRSDGYAREPGDFFDSGHYLDSAPRRMQETG